MECRDHVLLKLPHFKRDKTFVHIDNLYIISNEVNRVFGTLYDFLDLLFGVL
jgi:hypothetical protein